ncbi:MAG TPA: hypothetical protein VJU16_09465, partial [Planctomycetota bacterium]|nr:hypothetical protein [Planctomycetota bacterium]
LGREFVTLKHWSILWIGFAILLAMRIRKLDREDARWLLPVAGLLAIYIGVWTTFDPDETVRYVGLQGHRLMLHLAPIMLYWAAWRGAAELTDGSGSPPPIPRSDGSPATAGS